MSQPRPDKALDILMLASENGALPGGKVGGIGDVIRDAPRALAALGHTVSVITPGYGHFSALPGATQIGTLCTQFRGNRETVTLHRVTAHSETAGVDCLALEHPLFSSNGAGRIYVDDGPERPFATDASRFALFCAAAASAIRDRAIPRPDVVHLHDWHSALFALLLSVEPDYAALRDIPLVYTIHNLALQGIRPLRGDSSALLSWFPGLECIPPAAIDPRYSDCFNPVRAAINLSARVHTVSPRYADEICSEDSDFGCGLQPDLGLARDEGRLKGILNGCDYASLPTPVPAYAEMLGQARNDVLRWITRDLHVQSAHLLALHRLEHLLDGAGDAPHPQVLLTSVGRLTDQKLGLLCTVMPDGRVCLEHLLDDLGDNGLCMMLGNGDPSLEMTLARVAGERSNLLFFCGYSDALSDALYATGDLFLMPSTFEPCGISQMLAMRSGQPCLVNAVGGLVDTVTDGVTGFVFAGDEETPAAQALLRRFRQALACLISQPRDYHRIREAAAAERFEWGRAATVYTQALYLPLTKSAADTERR